MPDIKECYSAKNFSRLSSYFSRNLFSPVSLSTYKHNLYNCLKALPRDSGLGNWGAQ